ncbi:ComF family protein [Halorubrum halodurans]|uniref:ComF family protein n=1 Tax=Halorubrum halodurans TaxID=1383851 RepID=UPI00117B847C|nr:hypothetical protein [Halorubrum halodurans]
MAKTFTCESCQRTLPRVMYSASNQCTDCAGGVDTEEQFENAREQISNTEKGSSRAPIVDPSNENTDAQESVLTAHGKTVEPEVINTQSSTASRSNVAEADQSSSDVYVQDPRHVEEETKAQLYVKPELPPEYADLTRADVFAVGEYLVGRETGHSRKIVEFAKEDDESHCQYFVNQLQGFIDTRVKGDIHPDYITVYPSSSGGYHEQLVNLAEIVAKQREFEYKPLLYRSEPRTSQKQLTDRKEKWANQVGSIETRADLNDDTVIILDDVCTTGASLTIGTNQLLTQGAKQVIATCLGLSSTYTESKRRKLWNPEHSVKEQIEHGF